MSTVQWSVEAKAYEINGFIVHDEDYETMGPWAETSKKPPPPLLHWSEIPRLKETKQLETTWLYSFLLVLCLCACFVCLCSSFASFCVYFVCLCGHFVHLCSCFASFCVSLWSYCVSL